MGILIVLGSLLVLPIGGGEVSSPAAQSPHGAIGDAGPAVVEAAMAVRNPNCGGGSGCDAQISEAPRSGAIPGNNSTAALDPGGIAGWLTGGTGTYGVGYDPQNGFLYVTNAVSDTVSLFNGTQLVTSVSVGSFPTDAIFDPSNGFMYVENEAGGTYHGGNLTVLNGSKVVAWIDNASFDGPYQAGFDPANGYLYVPEVNGNDTTVVNGTKVIGSVFTGRYPAAAVYDPANRAMYVSNTASVANGGSTVSLVQNLTILATLKGNFTNPLGEVYDPANGYVYVVDKNFSTPNSAYVTVLNGTNVVGKIHSGIDTFGIVYDPNTEDVYELSSSQDILPAATDNVTVIHNLTRIENLTVGSDSHFGAFDPSDGYLFETNYYNDSIVVIDTYLSEEALSRHPAGNPIGTVDVGETQRFNVTLSEPGASPLNVTVHSVPGRIACGLPSFGPFRIVEVNVSVTCVLTAAGNHTVWLNVTDANSVSVWAWTTVDALGDAVVGPVTANRTSVDVGESVRLNVSASGGDGNLSYRWTGVPASCTGTSTPIAICDLEAAGTVTASAIVTDQNGFEVNASAPAHITVHLDPTVLTVTANRSVADVGQAVEFSALVGGGNPPLTFAWSGLPSGACANLTTGTPSCTLPSAGWVNASVTVSDSSGYVASSLAPVSLKVNPAPILEPPVANRTSVDVGQPVRFTASVSGGTGPFIYAWSGIGGPGTGSCSGLTSAEPVCTFPDPTNLSVTYAITDAATFTEASAANVDVSVDPALAISAFSVNRTIVDATQSVEFQAPIVGGLGPVLFAWSGLPSGCPSGQVAPVRCVLPDPGSVRVRLTVTDANGVSITDESTLVVTVLTDPTVLPVAVTPPGTVGETTNLTFVASATAGDPPYSYAWTGLPSGCSSRNAGTIACEPGESGTYSIRVTVTDALGFEAESTPTELNVSAPATGSSTGASGIPTLGFELGLVALVGVAGVAAVVWFRSRRGAGGAPLDPEDPGPDAGPSTDDPAVEGTPGPGSEGPVDEPPWSDPSDPEGSASDGPEKPARSRLAARASGVHPSRGSAPAVFWALRGRWGPWERSSSRSGRRPSSEVTG